MAWSADQRAADRRAADQAVDCQDDGVPGPLGLRNRLQAQQRPPGITLVPFQGGLLTVARRQDEHPRHVRRRLLFGHVSRERSWSRR
jgi:hypothetical protein